jgi:hypothetical protein
MYKNCNNVLQIFMCCIYTLYISSSCEIFLKITIRIAKIRIHSKLIVNNFLMNKTFCVCWTQYEYFPLSNRPNVAFCFAIWIQYVHLGVVYPRFVLIFSSHLHSTLKSSFSFGGFTRISFKCRVPCSGSVQVVSQRLHFAKTRVHSNSIPHAVCGGRNDIGTGFSASVWSCQCYSANGPYSLTYLLPVLCNISD